MRFLLLLLTLGSLGFGSAKACDPKYRYEPGRHRHHQEVVTGQLKAVKDLLLEYRRTHGRFPTNAEGLGVLTEGTEDLTDLEDTRNPSDEYYLYMLLYGEGLRADPLPRLRSGIVSPWLLPYGYENRKDLPEASFAGSPANADADRRWSVEVADGVYVWCLGARADSREYDSLRREKTLVGIAAVALPLLFGGLFVWLTARSPAAGDGLKVWNRIKYGAAGLFFLIWLGFLAAPNMVTCYVMRYFGNRQRGKRVAEYREILIGYEASGVLSSDACSRLLEALDRDQEMIDRN